MGPQFVNDVLYPRLGYLKIKKKFSWHTTGIRGYHWYTWAQFQILSDLFMTPSKLANAPPTNTECEMRSKTIIFLTIPSQSLVEVISFDYCNSCCAKISYISQKLFIRQNVSKTWELLIKKNLAAFNELRPHHQRFGVTCLHSSHA